MIRSYLVLLVLVSQINSNQVTIIPDGECDVQEKDLLTAKQGPVSVLKLLKEKNHSEDPEHISVSSSLPRSVIKRDTTSSSTKVEQHNVVASSANKKEHTSTSNKVDQHSVVTSDANNKGTTSTSTKVENHDVVTSGTNNKGTTSTSTKVEHHDVVTSGNNKKYTTSTSTRLEQRNIVTSTSTKVEEHNAVKSAATRKDTTPSSMKLEQPNSVTSSANKKVTTPSSTRLEQPNIVTSGANKKDTTSSSTRLEQPNIVTSGANKKVTTPSSTKLEQHNIVTRGEVQNNVNENKVKVVNGLNQPTGVKIKQDAVNLQPNSQTVKSVSSSNKVLIQQTSVGDSKKLGVNVKVGEHKLSKNETDQNHKVTTILPSNNPVEDNFVGGMPKLKLAQPSDSSKEIISSGKQSQYKLRENVPKSNSKSADSAVVQNKEVSDAKKSTEKIFNNANENSAIRKEEENNLNEFSVVKNIADKLLVQKEPEVKKVDVKSTPANKETNNNVRKYDTPTVNDPNKPGKHIVSVTVPPTITKHGKSVKHTTSIPNPTALKTINDSGVKVLPEITENLKQSAPHHDSNSPRNIKVLNATNKSLKSVTSDSKTLPDERLKSSSMSIVSGSSESNKESVNNVMKQASSHASGTASGKKTVENYQRLKRSVPDETLEGSPPTETSSIVTRNKISAISSSTTTQDSKLATSSIIPPSLKQSQLVAKHKTSQIIENCDSDTSKSISEIKEEVCHSSVSPTVSASSEGSILQTQVLNTSKDSNKLLESGDAELKQVSEANAYIATEERNYKSEKKPPMVQSQQTIPSLEANFEPHNAKESEGNENMKRTTVHDVANNKESVQHQPKDENIALIAPGHTLQKIEKDKILTSNESENYSHEIPSPHEVTTQSHDTINPPDNQEKFTTEIAIKMQLMEKVGDQEVGAATEVSTSNVPKPEALEQNADIDSVNILSSWKQRRSNRNNPDDNTIKSPSLDFPKVPEGESFRINELGLSEGIFVFSYLGSFLSWMQPYDFPVELLRDALWNRLSIVTLITQSLQVEMGFIACLCIGVLLALAAPLFLMIHACCSLVRRTQSSNSWEDETASSTDNQGNCRRRTLVFLLQTVLLLLVAGIVAMFVTNEQLSSAVNQTPKVVHTALSDITTFLRNSNLQLNFVVTKSLDQAVETASADLDNVETLLGRPIQKELEAETGVDVALDALVDVTTAAKTLSSKVDALHEYCGETRGLALVAQERLVDLRHQVDMLRRQCPAKDKALCETVEGAGLDVVLQLDSVLNDQRLAGLRRLSQSNLSQVTQQARGEFQFIPMHVEKETRDARNGVRRQLIRQRSLLDDAVWSLEAVSRDLGVKVDSARDRALQIVRGAADMEQWRYLTGVGAAVAVLLVWVLLVGAISCGCCGAEDKAGPTLLVTVGVLCPLYMALWALAMVALLVGGHGEVFVCRPLYDEPGYEALTKLMDKPGVLFQRGGGFFSSLLYGNESLNVPLKDVLMSCQQNRPSYTSFKLHQVFDVDSASNHREWETLHRQLARLEVNLTDLQLLTPGLQRQLQDLLTAASVNLTTHRVQLSGAVTGKDLVSFSDQLESVANQITDLATASRMETLATRTRRLLASHITPLTQRKEDMVYQLTALEVQLVPLQRQVNQSLSHLKTIQFFINNQGANISHIKSQEYINRIVGYLQQYRDHVMDATATYVAPCRPVWDLFHAMRVLFCRHVMDPLNGFWFATVWCLLLLLAAIPLSVKLAACYRQTRSGGLLSRSHTESPPEAGNIPDPPEPARPWASPGDFKYPLY